MSGKSKKERDKEKITVLILATTFALQPVCNVTRAEHALHLDQHLTKPMKRAEIKKKKETSNKLQKLKENPKKSVAYH